MSKQEPPTWAKAVAVALFLWVVAIVVMLLIAATRELAEVLL